MKQTLWMISLAAFLLAACASGTTPQALPTVALDSASIAPTACGCQRRGDRFRHCRSGAGAARMAFAVGGLVKKVNVKVGRYRAGGRFAGRAG